MDPGKIRLVVGEGPAHQLDVRPILVGKLAVPGAPEIAVTPRPLFFAGHQVVVGHVQHPRLDAVIVTAEKIEVGVVSHVGGRHRDVFVAGDICARGVIYLVVGARSDGEGRHVSFAVVHHGVHVRREHRLVIVVGVHGRVGPPQERLGNGGPVVEADVDFQIGPIRIEGKAGSPGRAEHLLDFAHPHRLAAVLLLPERVADRLERAGPVVLGPVELDAARNPGAGKPDQGRFNHPVVVDEMVVVRLIQRHLHPAAQLGQQHNFQITVFQENRPILLIHARVGDALDNRMRINHPAAPLVDPLLQKHRVLIRFTHLVGRDGNRLLPRLYRFRLPMTHSSFLYAPGCSGPAFVSACPP